MLVSGRVATVIAFIVFILRTLPTLAQNTTAETPRSTLFTNVRVFDGKGATLSDAINGLVRGNVIEKITKEPISIDRSASTTIVDGKGRTLMPGLIDAHVHMTFSTIPLALIFSADPNYTMLRDGKAAGEMLMRGFTSGRDTGGNSFGLKRTIDEGFIPGPRIWPSGAMISQTSGHGDYRTLHDLPRGPGDPLHSTERSGAVIYCRRCR